MPKLGNIIKYTSERQEKLLAMMERKKSLLSEAPEDLRTQIFQEIWELDEKNLEKNGTFGEKQKLEEMMKDRRNAHMEEGRRSFSLKVVSLG